MKRKSLKHIILALSAFLCVEIGLLIYQINSGTTAYARNLDLGNKYLLSEDYDNAISAFSKAIEIDAMSADAYIGRGDAYRAKGDYVSAWEDYEKAEEISGDTSILGKKIGLTEITVISEDGKAVDDVAIVLTGKEHSYNLTTDENGHVSEVLFPEKYNVEITKENYEPAKIELSAEKGGSSVGQIQLEDKIDEKKIALIEEYKKFISSRSSAIHYMIYDIDKDGYPELFFEEIHFEERESFCDIYYYDDGSFKLLERTYGPTFWHVLPTYASYPNGSGIIEYGCGKGREFVSIETWNEGVHQSEVLYNEEISEIGAKYYRDKGDEAYYESVYKATPINHQYYQSETSDPYFEGSYLLGQSSMDNFTALYEAFGVNEEDVATVENERTS